MILIIGDLVSQSCDPENSEKLPNPVEFISHQNEIRKCYNALLNMYESEFSTMTENRLIIDIITETFKLKLNMKDANEKSLINERDEMIKKCQKMKESSNMMKVLSLCFKKE